MNTKTVTTTQLHPRNSVADMMSILKQADQTSIVKDEKGRQVSAYLNPISLSVVIIADYDTPTRSIEMT